MTVRQTIALLTEATRGFNSEEEARAVARRIVMDMCSMSLEQIVCGMDEECDMKDVHSVARRLKEGCPAQYIVGFTEFSGFRIEVSPSVLIPRPETEYMVSLIVPECGPGSRVLDVCTGSGAIAIAIAGMAANSRVTGIDLSEEALEMAERNAARNGLDITFLRRDALRPICDLGKYDIVVSNPPYVPRSERGAMQRCVAEYEPGMALFVEDSDPLAFYRSISRSAVEMLDEEGILCFEIHERFGDETAEVVRKCGFQRVEVRKDQFGKDRIVWARK